jgi:hypothetical protein
MRIVYRKAPLHEFKIRVCPDVPMVLTFEELVGAIQSLGGDDFVVATPRTLDSGLPMLPLVLRPGRQAGIQFHYGKDGSSTLLQENCVITQWTSNAFGDTSGYPGFSPCLGKLEEFLDMLERKFKFRPQATNLEYSSFIQHEKGEIGRYLDTRVVPKPTYHDVLPSQVALSWEYNKIDTRLVLQSGHFELDGSRKEGSHLTILAGQIGPFGDRARLLSAVEENHRAAVEVFDMATTDFSKQVWERTETDEPYN